MVWAQDRNHGENPLLSLPEIFLTVLTLTELEGRNKEYVPADWQKRQNISGKFIERFSSEFRCNFGQKIG